MPLFAPPTEPSLSHSSDARNRIVWFISHIALCDEHARSTNTFSGAARSAYSSLTRSGGTCLSWTPATISVGVWLLPTIDAFHPQLWVSGARRTPVPHVAPTGSDASICAQMTSLAPCSY